MYAYLCQEMICHEKTAASYRPVFVPQSCRTEQGVYMNGRGGRPMYKVSI